MKNIKNKHSLRNGKIFGMIHILDITFVAILIAVIFFAVQFAIPREVSARAAGWSGTGEVLLRYTIELGERIGEDGRRRLAPEGFHENIHIGETLFDGLMGQEIGRIIDVYTLPFQIDVFDEDSGIFRRTEVPGLEYVYIVVEARAQVSDYETLIGHFSVGVGRPAFIRSKHFASEGFIIAMEKE